MKAPNYYARLHVVSRADPEVIKAAHRALMKQHHPDNGGNAKKASEINEAYAVLSDPDKRKAYDEQASRNLGGKVVGDYRILSKIAEGGFGKTYKAEHVLTGGIVCVKHCTEISPEHEEILVEEANAMWDLRHFSVPAVRTLIKLEDGSLALIMSYIEGPTISQVIEKHGPIEAEHVAWISQRILHTLAYLHSQGVVHGDLKPQNVIIQPNSHNACLVDFGLSMVKPKADSKAKGFTNLFAPPEQLSGNVLIPESDLYSLGMTMLFMLSGGDTKKVESRMVPTTCPDALAGFIKRLIVRAPLARPRVWSAEDLRETIETVRMQSFGRIHSNMKPLV